MDHDPNNEEFIDSAISDNICREMLPEKRPNDGTSTKILERNRPEKYKKRPRGHESRSYTFTPSSSPSDPSPMATRPVLLPQPIINFDQPYRPLYSDEDHMAKPIKRTDKEPSESVEDADASNVSDVPELPIISPSAQTATALVLQQQQVPIIPSPVAEMLDQRNFIIDSLMLQLKSKEEHIESLLNRSHAEIHQKLDTILKIYPELEERVTDFCENIMTVEVGDVITDINSNKNDPIGKIDRCDWAHSETEMLSYLHLFKPDRLVEYTQLIEANIGDTTTTGVLVTNEKHEIKNIKTGHSRNPTIELPVPKYGAQLVAFRAVLRPSVITDCKDTFEFVALDGPTTVKTYVYIPSKGLITPRINIPYTKIDENTMCEVNKGKFVSQPRKVSGISVDVRYVRDLYGIYRMRADTIPEAFRQLDFYGKYKLTPDQHVKIFQHDYGELQLAVQYNRLDIVKWILFVKDYDVTKMYVTAGNYSIKDLPSLLVALMKQSLRLKSYDVAAFLIGEFKTRYPRYMLEPMNGHIITNLFNDACEGKSLECVKLVLDWHALIQEQLTTDDGLGSYADFRRENVQVMHA
jgi:hypothetical protein